MIVSTLTLSCDHEHAGRLCTETYSPGGGVGQTELARTAGLGGWLFLRDASGVLHLCPRHASALRADSLHSGSHSTTGGGDDGQGGDRAGRR